MELSAESGELAIDDVPETMRGGLVKQLYAADVPSHVLDFIKPLLLGQVTEISVRMSNATSRLKVHRYAEALGLTSESTRIWATIPPGTSKAMRKKINARTRNNKSIDVGIDRATFRYKRISARTLAKFRADDLAERNRKMREDFYKEACNECGASYFTNAYKVQVEGDTECPHCGANL